MGKGILEGKINTNILPFVTFTTLLLRIASKAKKNKLAKQRHLIFFLFLKKVK